MNRILSFVEPGRKLVPAARDSAVVLSSVDAGWDGIIVERHRLPPGETPEYSVLDYVVGIQLGPPVTWEWQENGRMRQARRLPFDVSIMPPGVLHRCRWNEPRDQLVVALTSDLVARTARELGEPENVIHTSRLFGRELQLQRLGLALKEEIERGCPGGRLFGESLAVALTAHLVGLHSRRTLPNPPNGLSRRRLGRVYEHIETHLTQDLSISELADAAGLSASHFGRQFKLATGFSPHRYVILRRIERAKQMLATGKFTIGEVACRAGFADQSHLTRHFKRLLGVTPREFTR